jgi:membrane protein implicated in regulation of membrane protease activity
MLLVGAIALALFVLPPAWGLVVVSAAALIEVAEVGFWIRFLRRYRVQTGAEGLIGSVAEVIETCDPQGRVRLRGELWSARASSEVAVGERVRVTGVDGLTLEVEPQDKLRRPAPSRSSPPRRPEDPRRTPG